MALLLPSATGCLMRASSRGAHSRSHPELAPPPASCPGSPVLWGQGAAPGAGRDRRAATPKAIPGTHQEPGDSTNEDRQRFKWNKFPKSIDSKVLFKLCQEAISSLDIQQ